MPTGWDLLDDEADGDGKKDGNGKGWGGARKGAGRPARKDRPVKRPPAKKLPATVPAEPKGRPPMRVPPEVAAMAKAIARKPPGLMERARDIGKRWAEKPYSAALPPPGVLPAGADRPAMAMDDASFLQWAGTTSSSAGAILANIADQGLAFLGYPFLSELAQRPEFRVISETIATEMTRKWIQFEGKSSDEDERKRRRDMGLDEVPKGVDRLRTADRILELQDNQRELKVQDAFCDIAQQDGWFGRAHLFLDVGADLDGKDDELSKPIGNGKDILTRSKIRKKSFRGLRTVEAVWNYPQNYNASNPLRGDWYRPDVWYCMGKGVHVSRMPVFVGRPVPDILKPAYSFGGLSLSQMALPYVDNWIRTRTSVSEIIHAFSVMVLMTDLATALQAGGTQLFDRVALFNAFRDNQGLMVTDKGTEDFKNVSAPLGTLDALQAQSQEHMASVSRIPLVKLLGNQPKGLNATSEGDLRAFYDTIEAMQTRLFRPNLEQVVNLEQVSLWGEVDDDIVFKFVPLWSMTEKEEAELGKLKMERDQVAIDSGVLHPEEVRGRIARDPSGDYPSIDVEDVPDLKEEEEAGLMPAGHKPPDGEGGGAPEPGGEGGEGGGQDLDPFGLDAASWEEGKHKRDADGKFSSTGGGGSGGAAKPAGFDKPELNPADLKQVGQQKGSNPGGVFEDKAGKRFYVKKPQSPAHVRNEMTAAALMKLAGAPTLTYRRVGDKHVATEMAKLDVDNASKLSPEQKAEARKDFAVHAWLADYDAVGTGGDNLGVVDGKPVWLDLGGSLEFRAQGKPKGSAFGDAAAEWNTMRDPKVSKDAAALFGEMTTTDLIEAAKRVTSIDDDAIRETVKESGGTKALADKLIARKAYIGRRAAQLQGDGDPQKATSTVVFNLDQQSPVKELNGVPFKSWTPPKDWAKVDGQADVDEDEFVVPKGMRAASGVVIREPDGRIWVMRPKNAYGGYEHTFPKGGIDKGLSPQANAIKEAYEETGLKVRITGWLGDGEGDTSVTRYYMAEREAGHPAAAGEETEGIALVPRAKLDNFVNRKRDRGISAYLGEAFDKAITFDAWNEGDHPRGEGGKFTFKGSGKVGKAAKPKEAAAAAKSAEHAAGAIEGVPPEPSESASTQEKQAYLGRLNEALEGAVKDGDKDKIAMLDGKIDEWSEKLNKIYAGGAAAAETGGEKKGKKTAFGGLWKATPGLDEKQNFQHNVNHVLKNKTNAGSSYRSMLESMIKGAEKNGVPKEQVDALKLKLGEAYYLAGKKAFEMANIAAGAGQGAEAEKLNAIAMQAIKKMQEYGWQGGATPGPKVAAAAPAETEEKPPAASEKKQAEKAPKMADFAAFKTFMEEPTVPQHFKDELTAQHPTWANSLKILQRTAAEKAAAAAAASSAAEKPKQGEIPTLDLSKIHHKFPPPTEAELAKAKKSVTLQSQYVPGFSDLQTEKAKQAAQHLVDQFNGKYAGKEIKPDDMPALIQKVNDFKKLGMAMKATKGFENEHMAEILAKQKEHAAKQAAELKSAQDKAAKEAAAANAGYMKDLGIDEKEAMGFSALVKMMGGDEKAFVQHFKSYEAEAKKLGYPITGFQCALIKNYTDGGYVQVNKALRSDSWTEAQHVYAKMVNKALMAMPTYAGTLHRGTSLTPEQQKAYVPGNIVQEKAFTSTSKSAGSAFSGNTKFTITAVGKRAAHIKALSNYKNEDEVLFAARTFFKVTKVEGTPGGQMHVHMEEWEE